MSVHEPKPSGRPAVPPSGGSSMVKPESAALNDVAMRLREALDQADDAFKGDMPLQTRLAFIAGLLQGASWRAVADLKKLEVLR